jgi:hypothetical protein
MRNVVLERLKVGVLLKDIKQSGLDPFDVRLRCNLDFVVIERSFGYFEWTRNGSELLRPENVNGTYIS